MFLPSEYSIASYASRIVRSSTVSDLLCYFGPNLISVGVRRVRQGDEREPFVDRELRGDEPLSLWRAATAGVIGNRDYFPARRARLDGHFRVEKV
ncbi:MAG: hypothetical protein C0474_00625 [Sphingobium sp.]|nr:hypothetical protein [Sphingobium sp.]